MNNKVGFLSSLRDKKWELTMNFVTMVLGILIGFRLQQYHEQSLKDEGTNAKINLFLIELDENSFVANSYIKDYKFQSEKDTLGFFAKFEPFSISSATYLLEDENVFNVLELNHIALIKGYLRLVNLLNNQRDNYTNMLFSSRSEYIPLIEQGKNNLTKNAVSLIAFKVVMDQEFVQISRQFPPNNEKLRNIYNRIEDIEKDFNQNKINQNK